MADRRHRLSGVGFTGRLVIGAFLLALAISALWLWQQRDDDSPTENASGPQEVLEDYYAKIEQQDCGFIELATESYARTLAPDDCRADPDAFFQGRGAEGAEYRIGTLDIDKSMATAQVRLVVDGQEIATGIATLVMSGGEWKVDGEDDDPT